MKKIKEISVKLVRFFLLLSFYIIVAWNFNPNKAHALDCSVELNNFFDFLSEELSSSTDSNILMFQESNVTVRDPRSDGTSGKLYSSWGKGQLNLEDDNLTGKGIYYFSDRKDGSQRFFYEETDSKSITIDRSGNVDMKLLSWGDTPLRLENISCPRKNFLVGNIFADGRASLVTLTLWKATVYNRPTSPPPGDEPDDTEDSTCSDVEGNSCTTHPADCFGRGSDWEVEGRIQCNRGNPVCVAEPQRDYCRACGGECGGCVTNSCSARNLCAPGSICSSAGSSTFTCKSITITESSTGERPCTPISGFCWLPSEVGQETLICSEASN